MPPESPATPARRRSRKRSCPRAWRAPWAANRRPGARSPVRERSLSRANPRRRGAAPRLAGPNRAFQGPSEARPGSNRATRGSGGAAWGLKPVPERLARPALGRSAGRRPGWSRPAGAARRSGVGALPSGGRSGQARWAGPTPTGLPAGAGPGSWRRAAARRRPVWRSRGRSAALAISRWRPRPCQAAAGRAPVRWAGPRPGCQVSTRRRRDGSAAIRLLAPRSRRGLGSAPRRRDPAARWDRVPDALSPPAPRPAPPHAGWGQQGRW